MKTSTLKQRILLAFTGIIIFLGICILGLGFYVIKKDIIERAQVRVVRSLGSARTFYEEEINRIGELLAIADLNMNPEILKKKLRLDYFYKITLDQATQSSSEIVRAAAEKLKPFGGTRIIEKAELDTMDTDIGKYASIKIEATPMAKPTNATVVGSGMAVYSIVIVGVPRRTMKSVVWIT